jgi:hypothetical protein
VLRINTSCHLRYRPLRDFCNWRRRSLKGGVKGKRSNKGPTARISEGRTGVDLQGGSSGLRPRQSQKLPGSLSTSSVEARPSRREGCGLIGEGSVGRSGTDDTLLTPEHVNVRGCSRRGQEEEDKAAWRMSRGTATDSALARSR